MSMSQPAISAGVTSRPMPRGLATADLADVFGPAASELGSIPRSTIIASARTTRRPRNDCGECLGDFDILHLAVAAQMPSLNAVVVVDRIHAAHLAQLRLARLHVTGL